MGLFSKIKKIGKKIVRSPISQAIAPFVGAGSLVQASVAESLISRKRGNVPLASPGGAPIRTFDRDAATARNLAMFGPQIQRRITKERCPPGMREIAGAGCFPNIGIDLLKKPAVPPGGGNMALLPTVARGVGGALARRSGGAGIIRTTTGKISSIVLGTGQRFSRKNAAALIKRVGFEVGAAALGITVFEAAQMLLEDNQASTRRRRRGLSGADIRCATRTMRKVKSLACQLGVKSTAPRRRTCAK